MRRLRPPSPSARVPAELGSLSAVQRKPRLQVLVGSRSCRAAGRNKGRGSPGASQAGRRLGRRPRRGTLPLSAPTRLSPSCSSPGAMQEVEAGCAEAFAEAQRWVEVSAVAARPWARVCGRPATLRPSLFPGPSRSRGSRLGRACGWGDPARSASPPSTSSPAERGPPPTVPPARMERWPRARGGRIPVGCPRRHPHARDVSLRGRAGPGRFSLDG